jgi:FtsZ-binding cell division protein ZapB
MLTREKDSLADEIGIVRQRAHTAEANKRDQVMRLEQQLADSVATVAGLKSEVERTRERERSVTTQLANERDNATSEALRVKSEIVQMSSAWDTERGLLAKQIAANAAGRVDEFRKRLGSRLSRIAHDLPQKDTVMSLELGSAILLLFHQFVEALQEQDVPLTTGKNIQ